jgi:putative flippase GtrA
LEFTSLGLPAKRINRELFWFAAAGTLGFVVDTSILYMLQSFGLRFGWARIVSFLAAVITTWIINRWLTFRVDAPVTPTEFFKYLGAMSVGGIINYGVSYVVVTEYPIGTATGVLAVAAGSVSGLLVNYLSSKLWVFATKRDSQ